VGSQVVIIDDILDTGTTLVSACEKLAHAGAEDIEIMVTHGLFTGTHWRRLWELGVKRIFCTDTVPAACREERIVKLSVAPLLAKAIHGL
jgi:ribose-phosphate pyrophosphokinase